MAGNQVSPDLPVLERRKCDRVPYQRNITRDAGSRHQLRTGSSTSREENSCLRRKATAQMNCTNRFRRAWKAGASSKLKSSTTVAMNSATTSEGGISICTGSFAGSGSKTIASKETTLCGWAATVRVLEWRCEPETGFDPKGMSSGTEAWSGSCGSSSASPEKVDEVYGRSVLMRRT